MVPGGALVYEHAKLLELTRWSLGFFRRTWYHHSFPEVNKPIYIIQFYRGPTLQKSPHIMCSMFHTHVFQFLDINSWNMEIRWRSMEILPGDETQPDKGLKWIRSISIMDNRARWQSISTTKQLCYISIPFFLKSPYLLAIFMFQNGISMNISAWVRVVGV